MVKAFCHNNLETLLNVNEVEIGRKILLQTEDKIYEDKDESFS